MSLWVALLALAVFAIAAYQAWSKVLVPVINTITKWTNTKWDDVVLAPSVLRAFGQLFPALIVHHYLAGIFTDNAESHTYIWVDKLTVVYIVWAVWFLVIRLLKQLYAQFVEDKKLAEHSTKGLLQMFQILLSGFTVIIAISVLIGRSPGAVLATLGASTAILMLVFKDSILGLVAGVQLSANKMLKKGDWIVVNSSGANGEVEDVSLTTVKVRNWDESITTIPPYKLVSESFQNYANMRDGGGRQVRRAIHIDLNSVRFLTPQEMEELVAEGFLEKPVPAAGSSDAVNIRLLRHYLERMILRNENVRDDMRMMVRQLQPTAQGLPVELFFFVKQTEWTSFEAVQSDIFDEVYAVVNRFGLRLYQLPTDASAVTR